MKIDIGRRALHVEQAGQGPTILLVHGFPLDHSMWRGQLTGLSDAYRVVAPDLRGFGASDPAPGDATMQALADDLALLLDALAITEPITFCGLSMGGYVGWQFFLRHRARLSRLIQCDTRAAADTPEGRQLRLKAAETTLAQGVAPLVATMMPKLFAPQTEQQQPELVEQTRQVMLATSPATVAAAQRGMAERPDVTDLLGSIDVPTLIVCGEHDVISPADEMASIAAAIVGARFAKIAGAGHMAPLEDPQAVNQAIREFLGAS